MNRLFINKKSELNKKKKKGFTLIELIVVIAIISVLAAIAIPNFGSARKNSNTAADQANAKIIATAVATAVANGDQNPENEDVYSKYIDGGKIPKPKTPNTNKFDVAYDTSNGVTVTLNPATAEGEAQVVYPVPESTVRPGTVPKSTEPVSPVADANTESGTQGNGETNGSTSGGITDSTETAK